MREALRGSRHDYTSGPLGRAIVLLAIPMVTEMIMESVFAVADAFWVAKLGADALATVGLTESLLTLIYTAAMGLSIGVTAMVARRIGEGNPAAAAEAAVQGMALGLLVAAVIAAVTVPLAPRLLAVMGATPAVQVMGSSYARVMLGGNAVILLLFLINAIFRGAGDAAIAMRVLWLANGINIALGPCLIFGVGPFPRLGVTGAAIATTIGRGTGVLYQLYRLWRGDARVARQQVRQGDLPQPEASQVDPRGRPGVPRTVERLREHHPVSVEQEPIADGPQTQHRDRGDRRVAREHADDGVREGDECGTHRSQEQHVVESGEPDGPLGSVWLPGAEPLPHQGRGRVGEPP